MITNKFTAPIRCEIIDNGKKGRLLAGFFYYLKGKPNHRLYVPQNFITDFASIPRVFWNIYPPLGAGKRKNYAQSAILHDYLYDNLCAYDFSRKEADKIFLESMLEVGVSKFNAYLFYAMVRIFGKKNYKK